MTSPTSQPSPYSAPYPLPVAAPFTGTPPYAPAPGVVSAARTVAGIQAGISGLFALCAPPWAMAILLGADQERPTLHGREAMAAIWLILGLPLLAAIIIGVPTVCMRAGRRLLYRIMLGGEVVTAAAAIALACWLPSDFGLVLAFTYATLAVAVVTMLMNPTVRRWSGA